MKKQHFYIIIAVCLAVCAIVYYQGYWLVDIYRTLSANQRHDIQEVMRASDFEEIVHRVDLLKAEHQKGTMEVKVGVNQKHDKAEVINHYKRDAESQKATYAPADNASERNTKIQYDKFDNILRTEQDVMNVGLQMQRGIHNGLDLLKPVDAHYYDSLLGRHLDSMGVKAKHVVLLLRYDKQGNREKTRTIYRSGCMKAVAVDTFRFNISVTKDQEYVLLVKRSIFSLPPQMYPPILLSILTLLILLVAFWYIVNMLRKSWQLDETKSDFTNNITHELKTPIAVAYAANDVLLNLRGKDNPEKLKKYLGICKDQLSQLSELVEQILSMSMERRKSMKLEMEQVEVALVIRKIVANHQLRTKKPMTVEVSVPEDASVYVDRLHFTNIINNLVDNAIKYSKDELKLCIDCKKKEEGGCMISVTDNGIGIARDQQRYIFDKFYRVPHGNLHNVKGYGLGLYYVKYMMMKFGGSVSLTSELGKGTTFRLEFNR